ncbi:MAG TPA: hypothetical protein VMI35_00160, partial [Puia sp.]|nr:hypothetical protein [Puia sp.]
MRKFFILLAVAATATTQAQKMTDPKPFANSITEEGLKKHLYVIASRDFEGRETATEGQRLAAAYIENQFKAMGLQPGNKDHFQLYYPVFQDSLQGARLEVDGNAYQLYQDFDVSISANYPSTIMASDIVFAGYGITDSVQDDYKGLDVRG